MRTREKKKKSLHKNFLVNIKRKTQNRRKKRSVRRRQRGGNALVRNGIKKLAKLAIYIAAMVLLYRNFPLLEAINFYADTFTGIAKIFLLMINTAYSCLSATYVNAYDDLSSMVFGIDASTALGHGVAATVGTALQQADTLVGVGMNVAIAMTVMNLMFKDADILEAWERFTAIIRGGAAKADDLFEKTVEKLDSGLFLPVIDFKERVIDRTAEKSEDITEKLGTLTQAITFDIDAAAENVASRFMRNIYESLDAVVQRRIREHADFTDKAEGLGEEIGGGIVNFFDNYKGSIFNGFVVANDAYKSVGVTSKAVKGMCVDFSYALCNLAADIFCRTCTLCGFKSEDDGSFGAASASSASSSSASKGSGIRPRNKLVADLDSLSRGSRSSFKSFQSAMTKQLSESRAAAPATPATPAEQKTGNPDRSPGSISSISPLTDQSYGSLGDPGSPFGSPGSASTVEQDPKSPGVVPGGKRKQKGGRDPIIDSIIYRCRPEYATLDHIMRQVDEATHDFIIENDEENGDGTGFFIVKDTADGVIIRVDEHGALLWRPDELAYQCLEAFRRSIVSDDPQIVMDEETPLQRRKSELVHSNSISNTVAVRLVSSGASRDPSIASIASTWSYDSTESSYVPRRQRMRVGSPAAADLAATDPAAADLAAADPDPPRMPGGKRKTRTTRKTRKTRKHI